MDLSVYNTVQPVFVKFNSNENLPSSIQGRYMLHLIIPNIKLESGIPAIYLNLDVDQEKLELFLYQVSQDETLLYRGTSTFERNVDYFLNTSVYEYLGEKDIYYTKIENIITNSINAIVEETTKEESVFGGTFADTPNVNKMEYEVITSDLNIKTSSQANSLVNSDFGNVLDIIHTKDDENIVELIYNNVTYTYKNNDYISDNDVLLSEVLNKEIKEEIKEFAEYNHLLEFNGSESGSDEGSDEPGSDEGSYEPTEGTVYQKQIIFNFNELDTLAFNINVDCEEVVDDKVIEIIDEIINSETINTVGTLTSDENKIIDNITVDTITELNALDIVMSDIMNIVNTSETLVESIYYNNFIYIWDENTKSYICPDNNISLKDSIYNNAIKTIFNNKDSVDAFNVRLDDLYFNYDKDTINQTENTIIIVNTQVKTKDIYNILDGDNAYYTYLDDHNIERVFDGEVLTNEDGTYSGYVNKGYVKLINKDNGTYTYLVNGSEYIYLGTYIELTDRNFVGSVYILVPLTKHSKLFDNDEEEEEEDEAIVTSKDITLHLPDYYNETYQINTEYFDIIDWSINTLAQYFNNKNKLLDNTFTEDELNNFYSTFCKTILEYTQITDEDLLTSTNQIYKRVLSYYSTFMTDEGSVAIDIILNSLYGSTTSSSSSCGCKSSSDSTSYDTTTCYDLYKTAMQTYLTSMLSDTNFYKDWFFVTISGVSEITSYPNDNLIDRLLTLIDEFVALGYDLSFDTSTSNNCNCPVINTDTSSCNYTTINSYIKVLNWVKNNEITENTNKIKIYGKEFSVLLPKLQF